MNIEQPEGIEGPARLEVLPVEDEELQPLLLHSLAHMRELWLPLLAMAGVRSVTEIGAESGLTTRVLCEDLQRRADAGAAAGRVVTVDPRPPVTSVPGSTVEIVPVAGHSPEALEGRAVTDAYLIDGDHNYWTVSRELAAVEQAAQQAGWEQFPLVVLNDVSWPCARRDQYYEPDRLPAEAVHPYSYELGLTLDEPRAQPGGFRGAGAFAVALEEGGPANGVLTAVEDFVAAREHLDLAVVPIVFGLGVVLDRRAAWYEPARRWLEPFANTRLMGRLERNRLRLYLRVLELQDAQQEPGPAVEWSVVDAERSRLAVERMQWAQRLADLERAVADANERAEKAEAELAAHLTTAPARWPTRLARRASG